MLPLRCSVRIAVGCALGNVTADVRHGDRGGGIVVHDGDENSAGHSEGAARPGVLNADGEGLVPLDKLVVHDRNREALAGSRRLEDDLSRVQPAIEGGLNEVQPRLRRSGAADFVRRIFDSRSRAGYSSARDGDRGGAGRLADVDRRVVQQGDDSMPE